MVFGNCYGLIAVEKKGLKLFGVVSITVRYLQISKRKDFEVKIQMEERLRSTCLRRVFCGCLAAPLFRKGLSLKSEALGGCYDEFHGNIDVQRSGHLRYAKKEQTVLTNVYAER
jgi:hypothetical protein